MTEYTTKSGIRVRHCTDKDAVELYFPGRPPSPALVRRLKTDNWKFAAFRSCWHRVATRETLRSAATLAGLDPLAFSVLRASIQASVITASQPQDEVVCAWCTGPIMTPAKPSGRVSHGICPKCREEAMSKFDTEVPTMPDARLEGGL